MKKTLLFITAALMIAVTGCKKDSNDPTPTPTPSSSFSAKIDGTQWTATAFAASYVGSVNLLSVTGTKAGTTDLVGVSVKGSETGTYDINLENSGSVSIGSTIIMTIGMETYVGQIKITKFDKTAKLVSGTFSFDGMDTGSNIHHVTEGQFENVTVVMSK